MRLPTDRPPTHPGEILRAEFLRPLGVTPPAFAKVIGMPSQRLDQIVEGKRSITADTAPMRSGREDYMRQGLELLKRHLGLSA